MAAEVSSLLRILNANQEENLLNEPTVLITRDLLGSCSEATSADLDLDLQVPTCSEKRLDFKTGKVCVYSCKSPSPKSRHGEKGRKRERALRDLNFPPLNPLEESCLELKLLPSSQYQSVCTLDKVKSALERAEKETSKKRWRSSPTISLSSALTTREEEDDEEEKQSLSPSSTSPAASSGMFAAGCPGCLLYVMTYRKNPKCPRCDSIVPSPSALKKTRIDLNAPF